MNNPLLTQAIGVYLIDMDTAVEEQVNYNEDGSFSIFVNARLSCKQQMVAYQHALMHIVQADFSKECADTIESAM